MNIAGPMMKIKKLMWFSGSKENTAWLSIVSIGFLIVLKVVASFLTGSVGIRADAMHSGIDFVGAVVALVCIRISAKPPDQQHSFGHGTAL